MSRVRIMLLVVVATLAMLLVAIPAEASPSAWGSGCAQFYTVKSGDTLGNIAFHFGTTATALGNLNGISNLDVIYPGQTICVKAASAPPPPPPPHHGGFWYTVKCGDMLRTIAAHYGWGTWYLANVNHIPNPDVIYVGQKLWIPAH